MKGLVGRQPADTPCECFLGGNERSRSSSNTPSVESMGVAQATKTSGRGGCHCIAGCDRCTYFEGVVRVSWESYSLLMKVCADNSDDSYICMSQRLV